MGQLFQNFTNITLPGVIMWCIGGLLIYLAIAKKMEPALLLPMGFGAILMNLPIAEEGTGVQAVIDFLFLIGIDSHELFPLLLFIGIGAMIDFEPLLTNPKLMLFRRGGAIRNLFTLFTASLLGFELKDAASIAIIGAADGPTSIYVAGILKSDYMAAIMVAAYSYMALVPVVQPPVIRMCTTKKERQIKMAYSGKKGFQTYENPLPHHRHDDCRAVCSRCAGADWFFSCSATLSVSAAYSTRFRTRRRTCLQT